MDYDLPYAAGARNLLDIVWADSKPVGLAVFVQGGFWMRLAKSDWTQFAQGARARGWAVAIPSYTLAPQARIAQITAEIGAAISFAAQQVAGPIRLAGHSAGGHLVCRMICADSPLPAAVRARVAHVLSISGLHDLRPLMRTNMNATLNLDLAEARTESPALNEPLEGMRLTAWVGGAERPEFIRQAQIIQTLWAGFDLHVQTAIDGLHNHFTVIEGLKYPDSRLCNSWLD
jgi:acetyl esterase/lipase